MRWARWCVLVGVVLMIVSGGTLVAAEQLVSRYENSVRKADLFGDEQSQARQPRKKISGPVNVLLVGIDPRDSDPYWVPRADSVLVLHVPSGLDRGYLFSLPRDLLVEIPEFPKSGFYGAGQDKLAHAMYFGAQVPDVREPNYAQGFELLVRAVSGHTGITRFDAGAIIDFTGFRKVIDALGGVDMTVDQVVYSIHRQPDGKYRQPGSSSTGYIGPQMVYEPGRRHFNGWQALDYARQRYTDGGDYSRQRHQQQLVQAMVAKALSSEVVTDPIKLDRVLRAVGGSLTFSGRGYSVLDWALSLRDIRADNITMVQLAGGGVSLKGKYQGEQLEPVAYEFFTSIAAGTVEAFLMDHPELISTPAATTPSATASDGSGAGHS